MGRAIAIATYPAVSRTPTARARRFGPSKSMRTKMPEDIGPDNHAPGACVIQHRRNPSAGYPAEDHRRLATGVIGEPSGEKVTGGLGEAEGDEEGVGAC
eukprot:scaffold97860_cov33-Tisochrysis_lutea.AAC.1